jgi:hypothetical protein
LVLPLFVISTACATSNRHPDAKAAIVRLPPEIRTVYEYPTIPAETLICLQEPKVPDAKTDIELALWAQAVREAGADCRAKLDAIRGLAATWGTDG